MLSVKGTETFRQAHRRMRGCSAVLQGELLRGAAHEIYHGLCRMRESLAKLGLEEIAGEGQPGRGIRKPPVWEHHHVHRCRLTQGSDEWDSGQHLSRLDKGAVAIEPDTHGPPSYVGAEARLDILDHALPWLILAHHAYRDRSSRPGEVAIAPLGLLIPRKRRLLRPYSHDCTYPHRQHKRDQQYGSFHYSTLHREQEAGSRKQEYSRSALHASRFILCHLREDLLHDGG